MADLYQVIELSIAPVFLLAGVGGFLNVMSSRLGRVVDRARLVEQTISVLDDSQRDIAEVELRALWRRISLSNLSIGLCTFAGLLVCFLVVCLFIAPFLPNGLDNIIKFIFVLSFLFLIASLTTFLLEIRLATKTLRSGKESRGPVNR